MNEREVLGRDADREPLFCEEGRVGHDGDTDENYFHPGAADDGNVTLVNVTLFRGRDPKKPHRPTSAQGHEVIARLGWPGMGVPQRGSQAILVFPGGFTLAHGAGVVIATPGDPRNAMNGANTRTSDTGKHTRMTTDTGDTTGHAIYDEVSPEGFRWRGPWGEVSFGPNGFHVQHISGARIDLGAIAGLPAPLNALGSYCTISGAMVHVEGSAIAIGTEAGVSEPIAKATSVLAIVSLIADVLAGLAAGLTSTTGGPVTVVPLSPLALALTALASGLGPAVATTPSTTAGAT